MKHIKKLFLAVVCVGVFQNIFAYDEWNGWRSIELGETQQLSTTKTLTQSFIISGTLIIYPGGVLNSSTYTWTNNGYLNVWGGTLNLSGGELHNGADVTSSGTIQLGAGLLGFSAGTFYNGYEGSGTLTVTGGTFSQSGTGLRNGALATGNGVINIDGGTWSCSAGTYLNGWYGTGFVNVPSGTVNYNATNSFFNGFALGGAGGMTIAGGAWNHNNGNFYNGYTGAGNFIFSNGVFNFNSGSNFYNGRRSSGTLTISGGTWNHNKNDFVNGYDTAGQGVLNICGGIFNYGSTGYFRNGSGASSSACGRVIMTDGTWSQTAGDFINGYDVFTTGSVAVSGGNVYLGRSWCRNPGASTVNFYGAPANLGEYYSGAFLGVSLLGAATIPSGSSVTITDNGGLIIDKGGALTIESGASLNIQKGIFGLIGSLSNSGTFSLFGANASDYLVGSTFTIPSSTKYTVSSGYGLIIGGENTLSIPVTSTFAVDNNAYFGMGGYLDNSGTVSVLGNTVVTSGHKVTLRPGVTYTVQSGGGIWVGDQGIFEVPTNATLTLGSGTRFFVNDGTVNITGTVTQSAGMGFNGFNGTGTLTLTSGAWTSGSIRNGYNESSNGNVLVAGGLFDTYLYNGVFGTGTITFTGGTWTRSSGVGTGPNGVYPGSQGIINIAGGIYTSPSSSLSFRNGSYGKGIINISSGALNYSVNQPWYQGECAGSSGTINITGGALNWSSPSYLYNGYAATTTSTINVSGGAFNQSAGYVYNGYGVNSLGTVNIAGGTWNQSGSAEFDNGYSSTGNMTIAGGTMNWGSTGVFYNARNGSVPATLALNGGTWNHNGSGGFHNGYTLNSTGTVTIDGGGTWNRSAGIFANGYSGYGTLSLLNGVFNSNSGSSWFANGEASTGRGFLTIDGGTWNQWAGAGSFYNADSGMATFVLQSGTFNYFGTNPFYHGYGSAARGTVIINGGAFNYGGSGALQQGYTSGGRGELTINDGTFTMTAGEFDNGYSGTGYVTLNGGAVNYSSANGFFNGRYTGSTAFGRVTLNDGRWSHSGSSFYNGRNDGTRTSTLMGELIINGGLFESSTNMENGYTAQGRITINGGVYNHNAGSFWNGDVGSYAYLTINGGIFNYNSASNFYNGYGNASDVTYGYVYLNGGECNWNNASSFYNGYNASGYGYLYINGGKFNSGNAGTFSYNGSGNYFNLYGSSGLLNSSNYFYANSGTVNMPFDATFIVGSNKILSINTTFTYGGNIDNSSGGVFNLMGYPVAAADKKITVATGKTLSLVSYGLTIGPSNSVEVQPGANFNFGTSLANNGSFNLYGAQAFTPNSTTITTSFGTCDMGGGLLTIGSGRTLNVSDGTSFNYLGTLTKNGIFRLYGTYPSFASTTMTFTSGQNATVSPGTYLGVGAGNTIVIASGGSLTVPRTAGFNFYGNVDEQSGGTFSLFGSSITTALNSLTIDAGQTCELGAGGFFGIGPSRTITVPSTAIFTIPSAASFDYSGDVNEQSGGAFTLFGATASTASKKIIIDAGQICAPGVGTLFTIGNGNTLVLSNGSLFDVSGGFNVAGNIDTSAGGLFSLYGATMTATTNTMAINPGQRCALGIGDVFTLGAGKSLIVPVGAELLIDNGAVFKNLSSSTLDIYDTVKVPGVLENGDLTNAGIINVYYPGSLIIPGGTVINKHANSALRVNRGGLVLNYGGVLDLSMGTCTVNPGATVSNEAGAFNYNSSKITFSMGSVFNERDRIALSKDFDLDFTWTITVPTTIDGMGNSINFADGALQINSGASLLLQDVVLNGVNTNNIRCMDNTGTLSLKNVIWMQDGNYSFTQGAIDLVGDVVIEGPGTQFGYASTMTSTIHHNASLLFDNQTTFSYLAPSSTLLVMEDKSSVLAFDNAVLYAQQDMRLACGTILFDNGVTLSPDTGKTIYFGDKTNHPGDANYDADIDMLAAVNVAVYGNVVIDNVTA